MYGQAHIEWQERVAAQEAMRRTVEQKRQERWRLMRAKAEELKKTMQCNCDLDRWEPELSTGHSWVCRIHKAVIAEPQQ